MGYIFPTSVTNVSDSFADHVARGSVNPGTDYTADSGTTVESVAAGVVADADSSLSGSGGRTVHIDHDDGTGADYLHLSSISVSAGDRVEQGTAIAASGASGNGQEDFYFAHLHISFRRNHTGGYINDGNIDFDALSHEGGVVAAALGTHIPTKEEADMGKRINLRVIDAPGDAPDGTLYWYGERRGLVGIKSAHDAELLSRMEKVLNEGAAETILQVEFDRLNAFYL